MGKKKEVGRLIEDIVVDVQSLTPNPRNARVHPQSQIEEIAESIKRFGFTRPLIIDETFMLLAGHGSFEAGKLAGLTEFPCRQMHGLTDDEKRAYVIWDNKSSLKSTWDEDTLVSELRGLPDLAFTGFEASEVEFMEQGWQPNWEKVDRKLEAADTARIVVQCPSADGEAVEAFIKQAIAAANTFKDIEVELKS
jgi:hypothetical protein